MKKIFIFAAIVMIGLITAVFLFSPKKETLPIKAKPYQKANGEPEILYSKAQELLEQENLLEAKLALKKLLAEYPESGLVKKVRTDLDDLNIKILFSPIPTKDSVFYEVKPGDTLIKIARNFNTTVELIMKSNNLKNTIIRPKKRLKISKAKYAVLVDKSQNILMLKVGDEILKTYSVSTGENNSTPIGAHKIVNKLIDPTWFRAGAIVPPDSPENILGSRWMGLTVDGYGIHGTTDESTIGMQITAGCVRMKNKEVEELYSILPVGTEVTIID